MSRPVTLSALARRIIVICGSSKYYEDVDILSTFLSARGHFVFGFITYNKKIYNELNEMQKASIKLTHFRKIDLAEEVHIVNTNGYIGETTQAQLAYSIAKGKAIYFTDQQLAEGYMETYAHEIGKLVSGYMLSS